MKTKKHSATRLSEYDRNMLEKYTGNYTNFIESGTARPVIHGEGHYDSKSEHI